VPGKNCPAGSSTAKSSVKPTVAPDQPTISWPRLVIVPLLALLSLLVSP
jgi:hypothetical protein